MDQEEKTKYTPILPFNSAQTDDFSSYDHVKYVRNLAIMPENPINLHHDNMLKYYTYTQGEPQKVGGDSPD